MVDKISINPDPYDPRTEHNYYWYYDQIFDRWISTPKPKKPHAVRVETRITPEGLQVRPKGNQQWINYFELPPSIRK